MPGGLRLLVLALLAAGAEGLSHHGCTDDSGFSDPLGSGDCSGWRGDNCRRAQFFNVGGVYYTEPQQEYIISSCPMSCGLCNAIVSRFTVMNVKGIGTGWDGSSSSMADPYLAVTASVGDAAGKTCQTPILDDLLEAAEATYNHECPGFENLKEGDTTITYTIYDDDIVGKDLICSGSFPLMFKDNTVEFLANGVSNCYQVVSECSKGAEGQKLQIPASGLCGHMLIS